MKILNKKVFRGLAVGMVMIVTMSAAAILFWMRPSNAAPGDTIEVAQEVINVEIMQSYDKQYVTQTSKLTITDTTANKGWLLRAKLKAVESNETALVTDYVRIYSESSALCPIATACPLPTNGNEMDIYSDFTNTPPSGVEIIFKVDFTVPPEVVVGEYHVKLEYNVYRLNEEAFMQNFTKDDCAYGLDDRGEIVVIDARDGQRYRVRKFVVNGVSQCWMVDNLKLGNYAEPMTLTPADSDVTANWDLPPAILGGTSSSVNDAQWIDPANPTANGAVNNWSGTAASYCVDSNNYLVESYTKCGFLYNFKAATAGKANNNRTDSICPKNWKLPSRSFHQALYGLLGNDGIRDTSVTALTALFQGVYSGNYYSNLNSQGTEGFYVMSNSMSGNNINQFFFNTSSVQLKSVGGGAQHAIAVRCML
jgi:uncharacterized protein (TIGR02145 family)